MLMICNSVFVDSNIRWKNGSWLDLIECRFIELGRRSIRRRSREARVRRSLKLRVKLTFKENCSEKKNRKNYKVSLVLETGHP